MPFKQTVQTAIPFSSAPEKSSEVWSADRIQFLGLEITRKCNFNCKHCFTAAGQALKNELSKQEFFNLFDTLSGLEIGCVGWSGGEPLLRPDLEEIMGYACKRNIANHVIVSNGYLVTYERVGKLKDVGLRGIQISLEGITPEKNSALRGIGKEGFQRAIDSIMICKKHDLQVSVGVLLHPLTAPYVTKMAELVRDLGATLLRYSGFVPVGRGKDEEIRKSSRLSRAEVLTFLRQMYAINYTAGGNFLIATDCAAGPLPLREFSFNCRSGEGIVYVDSQGNVYPCPGLLMPEFLVGNVRKTALGELWANSLMRRIQERDRSKMSGPCKVCAYFEKCRGGCRGVAFASTGDIYGSYPDCKIRAAGYYQRKEG